MTKLRMAGAAAMFSASLLATGGMAQGAELFSGKTVSMYAGTEPGGTNDTLMRIVARHIGKYLPGNPNVVPKNMPGAGGRKLATFLYNEAAKDGTDFGVFQRAITTDPLLLDPNLLFNMQKFTWIGAPSNTTDICAAWHESKVKKIEDIKTQEFVLAGSGGETAQVNLLVNLIGGKVRAVIGYPGGSAMNLALERGEVDGRCALSWEATKTLYATWLAENKIKPLIQFALVKAPDLPGAPLIMDFARDAADRKALEIILAPQGMGFPFAGPPGLDPRIAAVLRDAFDKTMKDPATIAEAAKIQFELKPSRGVDLENLMNSVYSNPPEVVARAKELIEKK